jgi:hypothetical protein
MFIPFGNSGLGHGSQYLPLHEKTELSQYGVTGADALIDESLSLWLIVGYSKVRSAVVAESASRWLRRSANFFENVAGNHHCLNLWRLQSQIIPALSGTDASLAYLR